MANEFGAEQLSAFTNELEARALVRRAGGQQVVHAPRVAAAIVDALLELDLKFPAIDPAKRKELAEARRELEQEGRRKG